MYKVTLKNGKIVELSIDQIKTLLENWDKPEVERKINMIKEWERNQPQLTGLEKFRQVGDKLKRRE